jgi:hypothetical protein
MWGMVKDRQLARWTFSKILVQACVEDQVVEILNNGGLAHYVTAQFMGAWVKTS